MMRGPEVRFKVRSSIDALEREIRDLRATRELAATRTAGLAAERERLYRGLAEVYLPELGEEAVGELTARLPAVHARLAQILEAKRDELHALDRRRDEDLARRSETSRSLDGLTEELEALATERDRLSGAVAAALESDPRHAALADAVAQAGARLEQARRRHETAVLERDENAPQYENDLLFGYLLRRAYDTPEYNPSRLSEALDRWVARKVDYRRQHERYRLLQEVPEVAATGVAEAETAYQRATRDLGGLEKSIEDLHGLTRVVEEGERLYGERQACIAALEAIDEAIREATKRLEALESRRGEYYERARGAISEFLESRPIPQLRDMALGTATRKDDRLADALAIWEREWTDARRRMEIAETREQELAGTVDGLRKLDTRIRKKDYDASNSSFSQALDLDRRLKTFLEGGLTLAALWKAIEKSQRFEATKYQQVGPVVEAILWEVVRHGLRGGGGGGRRGGWGGGGGGGGGTTGGFGGFGGSRTTGGFG